MMRGLDFLVLLTCTFYLFLAKPVSGFQSGGFRNAVALRHQAQRLPQRQGDQQPLSMILSSVDGLHHRFLTSKLRGQPAGVPKKEKKSRLKKVWERARAALLAAAILLHTLSPQSDSLLAGNMKASSIINQPTSMVVRQISSASTPRLSTQDRRLAAQGLSTGLRKKDPALTKSRAPRVPGGESGEADLFDPAGKRGTRVRLGAARQARAFLDSLHFPAEKRDTLLLLFATAMIAPLCKKLGMSPILGFLGVGCLMGPSGLKLLTNVKTTSKLAELGIVFFLFEMGLELSVERLMSMRRDVFGLGALQFGLTAAGVAALTRWALPLPAALGGRLTANAAATVGGGLALSSSAFVLQLLKDREDMGTRYGRASFGILLFQDLAIVPLLVAIPLLAPGGGSVVAAVGMAGAKAALCLGAIALLGRFAVNPLFHTVAKSRSQEAFLSIILTTVLGMSALSEGLGLSDTLGAFLAGVLLGETNYRYQVEADVAPFRGILLGLFFMSVGFEIDLALLAQRPALVAAAVGGTLAVKAAVTTGLCLALGLSLANALQTGLLLSQGGEFAFVAFALAKGLGILTGPQTKLLMTTVALTMAATPALSQVSANMASAMENKQGFSHYLGQDKEAAQIKAQAANSAGKDFVIVCGYGRIGKMVCNLLDKKFIRYVCFDNNPKKTIEARNRGLPVFFGDVSRPEVLESFNVAKAKAVVVTLSDKKGANKVTYNLRTEFPDLPIFVRAVNQLHRDRLTSTLRVKSMVPVLPEDSMLVSLPFGAAVLRSLGISEDEVDGIIGQIRGEIVEEKGIDGMDDETLNEALGLQPPPPPPSPAQVAAEVAATEAAAAAVAEGDVPSAAHVAAAAGGGEAKEVEASAPKHVVISDGSEYRSPSASKEGEEDDEEDAVAESIGVVDAAAASL